MRRDRPTVLFVCLASGIGGSTRSLATVLDHLGGRITRVVASPKDSTFTESARERGLIDVIVPITGARAGTARPARLVAAARITLWTWRHRHSITAIHANGPEELNLVAPASLLSGIPIVVWSHARDVSPWMRRLGPIWARALRRRQVRWAAVSPMAARVLLAGRYTSDDAVTIVPNPIDAADVLGSRNSHHEPVVVGYLGSDATYKGFQLLPDVIARLRATPVTWALYTDPRSAVNETIWERLREMPDDVVRIRGKVADVREAYAGCDIVFVPSLEESFGRVAAEAMLNAIPVVASDLEPVRDLLGDEIAGLLFPPGDSAAAAAAIQRLVANPEFRHELGEGGVARARSFEPARIVDELAALYGIGLDSAVAGDDRDWKGPSITAPADGFE
jgi:phosphatidyl-myo-inositol alpha-mannosyltransferase